MSRTVPGDARQGWPYDQGRNQGNDQGRNQGYTAGQDLPGSGDGDMRRTSGSEYDAQWYGGQGPEGQARLGQGYDHVYEGVPYGGHGYEDPGYDSQPYGTQGYNGYARDGQRYGNQAYGQANGAQGYGDRGYNGQGYDGQGYDAQGYDGQGYDGQGYDGQGYDGQGYDAARAYNGRGVNRESYDAQGYDAQGYDAQGYDAQGYAGGYGYAGQPTLQYETRQGYGSQPTWQEQGYSASQPARQYGDYADPHRGPDQGYLEPGYGDQEQAGQEYGGQSRPGSRRRHGRDGEPGAPGRRKVRFRRTRKLMRYRTARVISAVLAVLLVWAMFSAGQATFRNNGQSALANFAEWARDHYLGPVVTFGEWLTYSPPKVGGKPSFSLSVPKNERVAVAKARAQAKAKAHKAFQPDIPAPLKALAGPALPGEGQWRVVEKVHGQPAIFTTFMRDATYTSYVNGIASIDPRLVKFQLHPGSEDPGPGNWGPWGSDYIPRGDRTGLLATFNSGFKLDVSGGGFYLNGSYHGSLVKGAASVVYYKNGKIKIGSWGSEVSMSPQVEGVRQNLKLLIDHGKLAPNLNQNIETSWGATLGGGYFVWRSGLGVTKDGRIIYVYGPALNVQDLAELLHRAGAVEALQLDINPYWMKFEYYTAGNHPSDPTPTNLLPTQQQSAYSYYSPYTRDFTAVYAR